MKSVKNTLNASKSYFFNYNIKVKLWSINLVNIHWKRSNLVFTTIVTVYHNVICQKTLYYSILNPEINANMKNMSLYIDKKQSLGNYLIFFRPSFQNYINSIIFGKSYFGVKHLKPFFVVDQRCIIVLFCFQSMFSCFCILKNIMINMQINR